MAIVNFAQNAFRSDSDQILVPRQKFKFTLIIDRYDNASILFTRIATVTAPSYTVDTTIMNQYNKKRVVQTRLNYDPVTVAFYDTVDNEWQDVMENYLRHYHNNGKGIEKRIGLEGNSTVAPNFQTDQGFTLNPNRYFFPTIRLIQHGYSNEYRETTLINPIITIIQNDTMDYGSSDPVMYTVTFQPESVQVRGVSPTPGGRDDFRLPGYLRSTAGPTPSSLK